MTGAGFSQQPLLRPHKKHSFLKWERLWLHISRHLSAGKVIASNYSEVTMLKRFVLFVFTVSYGFYLFGSLFQSTRSHSFAASSQPAPAVNYDIVYVRAPRAGDNTFNLIPEAFTTLLPEPGADLMLLHPDGSEEVLFSANGNGAVMDPYVSYDGRQVIFAFFPNVRNINPQRGLDSTRALSREGSDIYKIDLPTRAVTRLTNQEFTPNTGNKADFDCSRQYTNCPNIGVFNTGPAFLPDGRIVYTSTRDNYIPNKKQHEGQRAMQLWVMDSDGRNAQVIGHLNLASAMHPFVLKDGRIVFTSWENMGVRDNRSFFLWSIWPDGTNFAPFSGFGDTSFAHHFMTQISNGDVVVCRYYNFNNNGFGELYRFPTNNDNQPGVPVFDPIPPLTADTSEIPLKRTGYTRITPFTFATDFPAPCKVGDLAYPPLPCAAGNNSRVGKFTMPSAGPNNDLLVTYTRGAANNKAMFVNQGLDTPYYDAGIYKMRGDQILNRPEDLLLIKNDPRYNEIWPRAVVPYKQIYGVDVPSSLPQLENNGQLDSRLPEGTPFGLIGSSSLIQRDTAGFLGDSFYPHENNHDHNWVFQGADAGVYSNDDIYALRVIVLQPVTDRSYPDNARAYSSHWEERVRIIGEFPVRKEGVIDAQGNTDTSFLARIPADTPFTFQTLDRNGMVLNMAQTWHHMRPGEMRVNCGGCHSHSKPDLDFKLTAASKPDYQVRDLTGKTPLLNIDGSQNPGVITSDVHGVTVEYLRDIRPIFQAKCASCHTSRNGQSPAAGLDLDADDRMVDGIFPATYSWLVRERTTTNPTPQSITPFGTWQHPQATRYVRKGQSRQSLLVWKIFGRRLDGRKNEDRPTERVPGDASTIPAGVKFNDCDLDYSGAQMPPPSSGLSLTWEERLKIIRWIDTGAPIDLSTAMKNRGQNIFATYFEDDLRPTLSLIPSEKYAAESRTLSRFVIGTYDLESGVNPASLSLTLDRPVGNFAAGTNLASGLSISDGGIVTVTLPKPIQLDATGVTVTLQIRDNAGHITRIVRTYRTNPLIGTAATVSAASYLGPEQASDSIVSAFGTNLATETLAATSQPLPTSLAGTTVKVRDSAGTERLAPLFFVSPGQINFQIPPGTAMGASTVIITNGNGIVSAGTVPIATVAPAFFTASSDGKGWPAGYIIRAKNGVLQSPVLLARFDTTQNKFAPVPIDLGAESDVVVLELYGTGLRYRSDASKVSATICGTSAPIDYAGSQNGFVGLDQVNIRLPRSLAGRGMCNLIFTVDGKSANPVQVQIQ